MSPVAATRSPADLDELARTLDEAASRARATGQLPAGLSLEDAYAVQARSIARRHARGERRAGYKLGFTSRAKMAQMGLSEVIWGRLTDAMVVADGGQAAPERFIHPRVEPEVCFLLGEPLDGTVTALSAMRALAGVAPALELIDSRYRDFKFSLPDVVADNCSAAAIVVGPWADPAAVNLANLGLVLEVDGEVAQLGSTAAILGHPVRSLVAAARLVGAAGERLQAGDLLMAGGATEAVALRPGSQVRLEMVAGIDPASEGLARARAAGVSTTTTEGIDGLLADPGSGAIVFDATSAKAHARVHAPRLAAAGREAVEIGGA